MIKTIIFDIGNVLMDFDYIPYIKELLKDDYLIEKVNDAIWRSSYWTELDRGESPEKILPLMLAEEPDYQDAIRLAFENIGRCMHRADYAIPWIQGLKKRGYQVLYLSNYSEYAMQANPDVLDFLPLMDGGIFSCHVRLIKPDPAIYQKICEEYDLDPKECVFIDDNEDNVRSAVDFGIRAIQFLTYPDAKEKLNELLESNGI